MKRLVLLGGGHAHLLVLREFAAQPPADCEVVLVSPFPRQLYSGMIPGWIAGHYALREFAVELAPLAAHARSRLHRAAADAIDADARCLTLSDGARLDYDVLSVDVGSVPVVGEAKGVAENAVSARPLEALVAGWEQVLDSALRGEVESITIVGAGAAGVEVALAMEHRLRRSRGEAAIHIRIIGDKPDLATGLAAGAANRFRRLLGLRGIGLHLATPVVEVGAGFVRLQGGLEFASSATFWLTGPAAPPLLGASRLAKDGGGFLLTNDFLQSPSHANVFGVGDCAGSEAGPMPRAGVFAVRAAPALAANLRAAIGGGALSPHVTSRRYLALVSTGGREAVGAWNGFSWCGAWAWRWKDRIDRRFIAQLGSGSNSSEAMQTE